jgi:hypothetical protein
MLRCRCCLVTPAKAAAPMLRPCWRHDGCVPEADDDQLPALRRLRAAFGPIEVVEVISHDPRQRYRRRQSRGRGWRIHGE